MRQTSTALLCSVIVFTLLAFQAPFNSFATTSSAGIQSNTDIAANQTQIRQKKQTRLKTSTCLQSSASEQQPIYLAGKGSGKMNGPGNGTGNGGVGPKNGTGYGSKTGSCLYSS